MKRIIAITLMLMSVFALFSCDREYEENVLFSDETLAAQNLVGLPMPTGKETRLENDTRLYLWLSDEEYLSYVEDVLNYLRAREDIYYLGYPYSSGHNIFLFSYDILTPLKNDYTASLSSHCFVFSSDGELGNNETLSNESRITIRRTTKTETLPQTDFEFNTLISIEKSRIASSYDPCIKECDYDYENGNEYVIPGESFKQVIYICKNCGSKKYAEDYGSAEKRKVTVASGKDYILGETRESGYSGLVYEIKTHIQKDFDLKVTVNGTDIPKTHIESDYWGYSFIIPECEVKIEISPTNDKPSGLPYCYLSDYEVWLDELSSESVAEIKGTREYIGVAPGSLKTVSRTSDKRVIETLINSYRELVLTSVSKEDGMICGGSSFSIEFILTDGTSKAVKLANGIYFASDEVRFHAKDYITLGAFENVRESLGFMATRESYEVYTNDTAQRLVGEYSGIGNWEFTSTESRYQIEDAEYVISFDSGKIYIFSDTEFCINLWDRTFEWYELDENIKISDYGLFEW